MQTLALATLTRLHVASSARALSAAWSVVLPPSLEFDGASRLSLLLFLPLAWWWWWLLSRLRRATTWLLYR